MSTNPWWKGNPELLKDPEFQEKLKIAFSELWDKCEKDNIITPTTQEIPADYGCE